MKLNIKAFTMACGLMWGFGVFFPDVVDNDVRWGDGISAFPWPVVPRIQHQSFGQRNRANLGAGGWICRRFDICVAV